ncbi:MAG: coenzyme F420-0:L-glutamate ligase [Candidatus Paceibacteria bacterium]|jgi:coenzyme F420-0:L-glutamate ligase
MQLLPVQTKILQPPQDDLYKELQTVLPALQNGDVIAISSKVIAIQEGRCVLKDGADKKQIVEKEADVIIERSYWPTPLTITRGAFIGAAGVDESNSGEYYTLLPTDSFASAQLLRSFLMKEYGLTELGVVVTDSRSLPLRYGATAVAIGWWGIEPLEDHIGETDLFGRTMQYERSNIVDCIAAAAGLVMGEVAQRIPVVIIRDVPDIRFTDKNTKNDLFASFDDDTFRVLYERFISPTDK